MFPIIHSNSRICWQAGTPPTHTRRAINNPLGAVAAAHKHSPLHKLQEDARSGDTEFARSASGPNAARLFRGSRRGSIYWSHTCGAVYFMCLTCFILFFYGEYSRFWLDEAKRNYKLTRTMIFGYSAWFFHVMCHHSNAVLHYYTGQMGHTPFLLLFTTLLLHFYIYNFNKTVNLKFITAINTTINTSTSILSGLYCLFVIRF